MKSKTVLITGATSGIGRATAEALANTGAAIVLVGRSVSKLEATQREIIGASGNLEVDWLACDLSSVAAVREAAEKYPRQHLDVLINNAAVYKNRRYLTPDGFEAMFATNHIGPYLLTTLLLNKMDARPGRIVNVTAPSTTRMVWGDLNGAKGFNALQAFGASKMANLLFTFELARRLEDKGIAVNAYHPGLVKTGIMAEAPLALRLLTRFLSVPPDKAADGLVRLAFASDVEGVTGKFFKGREIISPPPYAGSFENQDRLRQESERLLGVPA